MKNLKDLCIGVLISEGENVDISISPKDIVKVLDVNFSVPDDFIKISLETSFGKEVNLVVKPEDFNKWAIDNKGKYKNLFLNFATNFIANSKNTDDGLNEIVDDDGNIMADEDMPSNSTNSMIVSPKFDLEKIFKMNVPKNTRFYSGTSGPGFISW